MAGILSQGSGMSGGVLSSQPRSLLERLGIGLDLGSPDNQVPLAFLSNVISTPGASPFQGVPEAAQNAQVMQQRKVELSQLIKKRQQEDEQTAAFRKMVADDPAATQLLNAGQPQAALDLYQRKHGLLPPDLMSVNAGDSLIDKNNPGAGPIYTAPPKLGAGAGELSLTPTWAIDQDQNSPTYGKPVIGQIGKDGVFHRTKMDSLQPIDPASMAGGKAGNVADAKTIANAKAALPGLEQSVTITKQAIDHLRNDDQAGMDEQFGNFMGVPQQMLPVLPKSNRANFLVDLEQANGGAFMQARQGLKGGGQITDYEGRRAEAAYSKMDAASKSGDKAKFLEALDEFEQAVEQGYQKLQAVANSTPGGGSFATGGVGGGPSAGATLTYNPQTGELE